MRLCFDHVCAARLPFAADRARIVKLAEALSIAESQLAKTRASQHGRVAAPALASSTRNLAAASAGQSSFRVDGIGVAIPEHTTADFKHLQEQLAAALQ